MNNKLRVCEPNSDDLAWLGSGPIPAKPYYDAEYFDLEREAIFKKTWIQIAHISEFPEKNSFIVRDFEVANTSILIVMDNEGVLRAFHNVCTHRGTRLVEESDGKKNLFSCPYHKWTFSNEGELVSAPDFGRFFIDKSECALPSVSVDTCGGFVFINLDVNPSQTISEFLGPYANIIKSLPSSQADTFAEYVYEIDANWKVTYDNFQENYHLRFVHSKTGAAVVTKENPFAYPSQYCFYGPHRSQIFKKGPMTKVPEPIQKLAFEKSMAGDGQSAEKTDCKLFPNLFVVGLSTYVFSHCIMPISNTKSRGIVRVYWKGNDDYASKRFAREYMVAALRDVHIEDISIIERGQLGLSSGSIKNINFQIHESLCRHLSNVVSDCVDEYKKHVEESSEL